MILGYLVLLRRRLPFGLGLFVGDHMTTSLSLFVLFTSPLLFHPSRCRLHKFSSFLANNAFHMIVDGVGFLGHACTSPSLDCATKAAMPFAKLRADGP